MIKINDSIEIPGFVIHSEEFMKDMDDRLIKTENLLFAAEEVLRHVPIDGGLGRTNTYLSGFTEALDKYKQLRK